MKSEGRRSEHDERRRRSSSGAGEKANPKRRSSDEMKKTRSSTSNATKPKRRLSQDDSDIEILLRRHSGEREKILSRHSKCDLNVKRKSSSDSHKRDLGKELSSRRRSGESKVSASSTDLQALKRRSSDDTKGAAKSTEKGRISKSLRPSSSEKVPSESKSSCTGKGNKPRKSSTRSSSDKGGKSPTRNSAESGNDRQRKSLKVPSSTDKGDKQSSGKPKRQRRTSIDDFAILELEAKNRRKSNESKARSAKDDMEILLCNRRKAPKATGKKKSSSSGEKVSFEGKRQSYVSTKSKLLRDMKIEVKPLTPELQEGSKLARRSSSPGCLSSHSGSEKDTSEAANNSRRRPTSFLRESLRRLSDSGQFEKSLSKNRLDVKPKRRSLNDADKSKRKDFAKSLAVSTRKSGLKRKLPRRLSSSLGEGEKKDSRSPLRRKIDDEAEKNHASSKSSEDRSPERLQKSSRPRKSKKSREFAKSVHVASRKNSLESRALRHLSSSFGEGDKMKKKKESQRDDSCKRHSSDGMLDGKHEMPKSKTQRSRSPTGSSSSQQYKSPNRRRSTADSSDLRSPAGSSYDGEEPKTPSGEPTHERSSSDYKKRPSTTHSNISTGNKSSRSRNSYRASPKQLQEQRRASTISSWQLMKKRKWRCLCCIFTLALLGVTVILILTVLQSFLEEGGTIQVTLGGSDNEETVAAREDTSVPSEAPSESKDHPKLVFNVSNPTTAPTKRNSTNAPTSSPLSAVTIVVIVELDAKPEDVGFSLVSSNTTSYINRPVGSLSGLHGEVIMDVIDVVGGTDLVFEVNDAAGDGLGYYRVIAGTGDEKLTLISGDQEGTYTFTAGEQNTLQIGGLDWNESCKPCQTGKNCGGRCAWCNANDGFLSETVFSYECHTQQVKFPKRCFTGEKRLKMVDVYSQGMAECTNGFEVFPLIDDSHPDDAVVCVEEAKCVKSFPFSEPNCEDELSGSILEKVTCQDTIRGNEAPREHECAASSGELAVSIAPRCCVDGVAFCSSFQQSGNVGTAVSFTVAFSPTIAPTISSKPTYDGHPLTLLLQLDNFPLETGFSITSVDKQIVYLERPQGYYQKTELVLEKVQIPDGKLALLTLTDREGDGICCTEGEGYFQLYSDDGSLILDGAGEFLHNNTVTFTVGNVETLPPTASTPPSVSPKPTFNQFPVSIVLQLDQWSAETGINIQDDKGHTFFNWPPGSFSQHQSSIVKQTVMLPRDAKVSLDITDTGEDGFCCLYGDGWIKVYAGDDADDETALLAFEQARFESEMSIRFRAGPPDFTTSATSSSAVSDSATSGSSISALESNLCKGERGEKCVEITMTLQLDRFSSETSWFISSSDGQTNFIKRPGGYYEQMKEQKVIETVWLPEGEYEFRIIDYMGDGICCWAGQGWYSIHYGHDINDHSTQILYSNGDFGKERVHIFAVKTPESSGSESYALPHKPTLRPTNANIGLSISTFDEMTSSLNLSPRLRGSARSSYKPQRLRKHEDRP